MSLITPPPSSAHQLDQPGGPTLIQPARAREAAADEAEGRAVGEEADVQAGHDAVVKVAAGQVRPRVPLQLPRAGHDPVTRAALTDTAARSLVARTSTCDTDDWSLIRRRACTAHAPPVHARLYSIRLYCM
jgi:hypothetical protein